MRTRTERFELRLTPEESEALRRLAAIRGLTSSELIQRYIKRTAKREYVWCE